MLQSFNTLSLNLFPAKSKTIINLFHLILILMIHRSQRAIYSKIGL